MTTPDTELFPEDLLEDALAPERPNAEAFEAEVARRVAEGQSESVEPTRAWPVWLKRAAAILPPGVIDLALVGKLSGATGGASKAAPGLAWLAAPWAMLLIVAASLVGAMHLTSKLDASQSGRLDGDPRKRRDLLRRPSLAVFSFLIFLMPLALLLGAALRGHWALAAGVILLTAAMIAAMVLTLSRAGFADRSTVAQVTNAALGQFVGIAIMLPTMMSDAVGPLTIYGMPAVLLLGMLGANAFAEQNRRRLKYVAPFLIGAAVLLPLITRVGIEAPFGQARAELEGWVSEFDEPVDEMLDWSTLGHARAALGPEPFDALDLSAARDQLPPRPQSFHPVATLGAWRAGLASGLDVQAHRRSDRLIDSAIRRRDPATDLRDSDTLEVIALSFAEALDDEGKAWFRAALEASLPEPGDRSSLEQARNAIDMATALGLDDFVDRRRADLRAIVAGAYDATGPSYAPAGGFGNWLGSTAEGDRRIHPTAEDTLLAIDLMARVGVPDGVDLRLTDRFLYSETLGSPRSTPHIFAVQAALARHHLQRAFDVPSLTAAGWLQREMLFICALALIALCLWIIYCAPVTTRTTEPSGAADRGGSPA